MNYFLSFILLCFAWLGYAQSATSPYVPTLPPIQKQPISPSSQEEKTERSLSLSQLPQVTLVTEGGNNPGQIFVQGFHNYRVEIFVNNLPYPKDASGSYNLWALQQLKISHYEIKQGSSGFVQLWLYTQQNQSPFFINYSHHTLLPASHYSSVLGNNSLGLGSFLQPSPTDTLTFNLNTAYQLNRYFSPFYNQDIANNRFFLAGTLTYNHNIVSTPTPYVLGLTAAASVNKTKPKNYQNAPAVTAVHYNTQEASIFFNSEADLFLLKNFITFSRTAYTVPPQDLWNPIRSNLYQLTAQHQMGLTNLFNKGFFANYGLGINYSNYNYNNEIAKNSFMLGVTPALQAGRTPLSIGWGGVLTLAYPLNINNSRLVYSPVATATLFYQTKHLKPLLSIGFVRRDPNALELYFPNVSNPQLQPEYYAYGRLSLETKIGEKRPFTATMAFESGYIRNAIVTGQQPFNSLVGLYRFYSSLNLSYTPHKQLMLLANFSSSHSFTLQHQPYNDLAPKFTFQTGLQYNPLPTLALHTTLQGTFYAKNQTGYPTYTLKPTFKLTYTQNNHFNYFLEAYYTATPHFQPLTPYGSNALAQINLGVNYAF